MSEAEEREAFNTWNSDASCPLAGREPKTAAWLAWQLRAQEIAALKAERDALKAELASVTAQRDALKVQIKAMQEYQRGNETLRDAADCQAHKAYCDLLDQRHELKAELEAARKQESIGWVNKKYGTYYRPGQLATTSRNNELIASGELIRVYPGPVPAFPSEPPLETLKVLACWVGSKDAHKLYKALFSSLTK